ncbi:spermidine/putrescine ABC transporter permease PotB [Maridesulfovibrio bastinii]|uniref:spermidine/putrescine ABC transporter permease PotB n=1 Tax=Maridesulfovibrio bastinii TaxID=47157 RepID=UPI0003FF3851|nr:spermidine/putrescine ABC transporter permease PotB [Maridesulfovibrio bastinii]
MLHKTLFKTVSVTTIWCWLFALAIVPNLLVLGTSFLTGDENSFVRFIFSIENYARLFDPALFKMIGNSVLLAGATSLVCLLIGYPFAWFLAHTDKKKRAILLMLVVIPFWTNSLVRTYALVALINASGIINKMLMALGIIRMPLQMLYTRGAVLLGLCYTLLPFMVLPLYSSILKLDHRLLEASRDLGASPAKTFIKVALPLTVQGIVSGCMLVFLPALGMFYIPDILGGAREALVGNFIRDQFLVTRDWPMGSAASVLLSMIMGFMLLFNFLNKRKLRRGRK